MTRFTPTIDHDPDREFPVEVRIPGEFRTTHGFKDQAQADRHLARLKPESPYATRVTTHEDALRRILEPLVEIAGRNIGIPELDAVHIQTLDDGTVRIAATDRFIILRGSLVAPVLGDPIDLTIRTREASSILGLLREDRGTVEHCEACAESGAIPGCDRSHISPDPVILDVGPGTIKATVAFDAGPGAIKATVAFDAGEEPAYWSRIHPHADDIIHPDNLDEPEKFSMAEQGIQPGIVPPIPGLCLFPRATADGKPRWGIVPKLESAQAFDGILMPIPEGSAR